MLIFFNNLCCTRYILTYGLLFLDDFSINNIGKGAKNGQNSMWGKKAEHISLPTPTGIFMFVISVYGSEVTIKLKQKKL